MLQFDRRLSPHGARLRHPGPEDFLAGVHGYAYVVSAAALTCSLQGGRLKMTMPARPIFSVPALPHCGETFRPTRWSLVKRAAFRGGGEDRGMEEFCRIYWYPLYAAARGQGQSAEDACDAVQTLFAGLIEKETLRRADPERGRLRTFLLTMLQNQIRSGARAARAQKRGGGCAPFSLDCAAAGAAWEADPALRQPGDPVAAWRRNLAAALLDEAVESLAAGYRGRGREELFLALLPALEGPLPDTTYQETAERLGVNGNALRMASVRLRERFRKTLRTMAAAALGVPDGPLLDEELRELFSGPL